MFFIFLTFCRTVVVEDCVFFSLSLGTGHGGAIKIDSDSVGLEIKKSVFYCCRASGNGGAIYSLCANISLNQVCAFSCMTTAINTESQFAYFFAYKLGILRISDTSITKCPNNTNVDNRYHTLYLVNGTHNVCGTNISDSQIRHVVLTFYRSIEASFSYSTVSKCSITTVTAIYVHYHEKSHLFSRLNILSNTQGDTNYGLLYYQTKSSQNKYNECVISRNTNNLFYISEGTIDMAGCYINHPSTKIMISIGSGNTLTDTNTHISTIQLAHFSSHVCSAEFSFVPPSAIPNSLSILWGSTIHLFTLLLSK